MKNTLFVILLLCVSSVSFGQLVSRKTIVIPKKNQQVNVVYGKIVDGDTVLVVNLPEVDISLMQDYFDLIQTRSGKRLVRNIKKVYPYAKQAGLKLQEYDSLLVLAPSDNARRNLMKKAEDEIMDEYGDRLKDLTFTQGNILIRLIDRETGNTSYSLVRDLRGKLRAAFYQGFARLWGYNLKTEYDPKNNPEDQTIETIITLIEKGCI